MLGVQAIALYALVICDWHISDNCVLRVILLTPKGRRHEIMTSYAKGLLGLTMLAVDFNKDIDALYFAILIFLCSGTSITNTSKGKWFRFNDNHVEEFIMSDAALEAECFGGSFRTRTEPSGEQMIQHTPYN